MKITIEKDGTLIVLTGTPEEIQEQFNEIKNFVFRSPSWQEEAYRLARKEGKVQSIKYIREQTDYGLKEAKDWIEANLGAWEFAGYRG